jgi:hypothetical protein
VYVAAHSDNILDNENCSQLISFRDKRIRANLITSPHHIENKENSNLLFPSSFMATGTTLIDCIMSSQPTTITAISSTRRRNNRFRRGSPDYIHQMDRSTINVWCNVPSLTSLMLLLFVGTFTIPTNAVIGGLQKRIVGGNKRKPNVSFYTFTKTDDDENDNSVLRRRDILSIAPQLKETSASSVAGEMNNASTSTLADITTAFRHAISKHQRQTEIHVGKFLHAMDKMERHMRKVGMTQSANDLRSNYEKAMRLYQAAPEEKRDSIVDILQWEIETGVHGPIPPTSCREEGERLRVHNNSGAMGLSWLGHSVEYQYDLYRLMLEGGYNPKEAAAMAFQQDLEPHLDWASSKLGRATIPRLTPASQTQFFSMLGGYPEDRYGPKEDATIRNDVLSILGVWDDMIGEWRSVFEKLQLRDI